MKEVKILMPELKPGIKTATLCAWLKEEGETVKAGEALIEKELKNIPKEKVRNICIENLKKIVEGQRDFRF